MPASSSAPPPGSSPNSSSLRSPNDREVIARYLEGDRATVALVDDWIEGASIPFRKRLAHDWSDIEQGIRVEVLGLLQREAFEGRSGLKTYVWRVATHSCLDAVRRLDRVREVDPEPVFERLMEPQRRVDHALMDEQAARARSRLLTAVLSRMKPECVELWRAIMRGQSYKQMSAAFGVSAGTLRVRASRCRERARAVRDEIELELPLNHE